MRKLLSGRRRYALAFLVVGASLAVMGAQCQPPKPAAPSGLRISPTSADFGFDEIDGTATASQTFTVTNLGPDTSGVLAADVANDAFEVTDVDCVGNTLAEGDSCTIDVAFNAAQSGPDGTALDVTSDVPADGVASAALSGFGFFD